MALGSTPGPELKQVFYVGSFDPQGQVPPEVYRITVRGQGSLINQVKFASGWVPAGLADALSSDIAINSSSGAVTTTAGASNSGIGDATLATGRRQVLFGPDGFRAAPRSHRLVIAMGANADDYFNAIDTVLGDVATMQAANSNERIVAEVFKREKNLQAERMTAADVLADLQATRSEDLQQRVLKSESKQQGAERASSATNANGNGSNGTGDAPAGGGGQ